MNNKHYIGQKAKSITLGIKQPPISKVILNGDNDAVFEVGDDSGQVLETYVPSATQSMALNILNRVKGFAYQGYRTTNAFIVPNAELGDGITVGGVYGILAHREFSFNPKLSEDVSSPYQQEADHEYNYEGTYTKQIDNKVQIGALYYGTRITRKNGIEVIKTDGNITKSRVILNSDLLAFYNDNGREAFYFDGPAGVFRLTQYADVEGALLGSESYSKLELTAQQLNLAIQDANRNITSLQITSNGLTTSVSGLSNDISDLGDDISDLDGNLSNLSFSVSTLEQKVDSFKLRVQNGIKSSTIYLDAGNINLSSQNIEFTGVVTFTDLKTPGSTVISGSNITTGKINAQYLDLTGAITFSDFSTSTKNTINTISDTANNAATDATTAIGDAADAAYTAGLAATAAKQAQNDAEQAIKDAQAAAKTASDASTAASTVTTKLNSWSYGGGTYINGAMIATGTVVASTLAGGSVDILTAAGKIAGKLTCTGASSANFAVELASNGALRLVSENFSDIYLHRGKSIGSGHYVHLNSAGVFIGNSDLKSAQDGTYDCGGPSNKWNDLYAKNTTIQTSDRNEKYCINYDISNYDLLFDSLKPCSYKLKHNESDRTHFGMIAQDIEEVLNAHNIDSQDFAPFIKYRRTDENNNPLDEYGYGLRYTEFIALLIHQTQQLKQRVTELEAKI